MAKSYRPISITSCLAWLYERLLLARLQSFLNEKIIIVNQQSGFRRNRSTKDNLIFLTQKVQQGFSEKKKTLAIFFDIASAFDKVWHRGLIFKMAKLKIPFYIIKSVHDLLSNRTFVVKVDNSTSGTKSVKNGLPQGAVLSPTLFSIYINDLPFKNTRGLDQQTHEFTVLFADDICHMVTYNEKSNAEEKTKQYLEALEKWMNTWRLTLAPHKCSQIIFERSKRYANEDQFNICICIYGESIPRTETSYNNSWRIDQPLLIQIYKTLLRSIIDYASFMSTSSR